MCGIAGFLQRADHGSKSLLNPRLRLGQMMAAMQHRGPDDWGMRFIGLEPESGSDEPDRVVIESSRNVRIALGHRRLAILDLSAAGRQPMTSSDGACTIVFNGEIYNYIELREELRKTKRHFKTSTDTEVLLAAYQEWGTAMLQRLDGMFAFALWDRLAQKLICARDPFAIKPFYYSNDESGFVFASEPRGVLVGLGTAGRVDRTHMAEWLALGISDYDEGTFYEEVKQLRGGEWIEVSAEGTLSPARKFWQPPPRPISYGDEAATRSAISSIREMVDTAVKRQLRSDVPVGGSLSGGLDSGAIMVTASRQLGPAARKLKALTSSNVGFERDETAAAQQIANHAGLEWHGVHVDSADMPKEVEALVQVMGEPFAGWSMFASYKVMQKARDLGLKVLLNGQGGDEVFLGYPRAARRVLGEIRKDEGFSAMFSEWLAMRRNMQESVLHWLAGNFYFSNAPFALRRGKRRLNRIVSPEALEPARVEVAETLFNRCDTHEAQVLDLLQNVLPRLLRFEDRNSMAFAIELRVPMLAVPLVDAGLRLPLNCRVRNGYTKYALRKAMEDRLPAEIAWHRAKRGFDVPEARWTQMIRPHLAKWFGDLPKDAPINTEQILREIDAGRGSSQWFWRCISTALWLRFCGARL